MAKSSANILDFSGGFHTDTPVETMSHNDLLIARNCIWRNGLVMRGGFELIHTFTGYSIAGIFESRISGSLVRYFVVKNQAGSFFLSYKATTYQFVALPGIPTSATKVEVVEFGGYVVITATNRSMRPIVVTYSNGSYSVQSLESLDSRIHAKEVWGAGYFTPANTYVDDTQDAQDTLWPLAEASGRGFYIASDLVFNRVVLTNLGGSAISSIVAQYWNGSSWVTISTSFNSGVIQWDLPFSGSSVSFETYSAAASFQGQFVMRFVLTYSGAAPVANVAIGNSQALRVVLGNQNVHGLAVYRNMLCLVSGNVVNFSPVNLLTGWRGSDVEIFVEGGDGIIKVFPFEKSMLVVKPGCIYQFSGNSFNNPEVNKVSNIGTTHGDSIVQIGTLLFMVSGKKIMALDTSSSESISSHIRSFLSSMIQDGVVAAKNQYDECVICSNGKAIVFDPNSIRKDSNGNTIVSVFEFTGYGFTMLSFSQESDQLVGVSGSSVYALETGTTDDGDPIAMIIRSSNLSFGDRSRKKIFRRWRPAGLRHGDPTGIFDIEFWADGNSRNEMVRLGKVNGAFLQYFTSPYEIDGYDLEIEMSTESSNGAGVLGISIDVEVRKV